MFDAFNDDGLNPKFVYCSPVFLDELDRQGCLPADCLAEHVGAAVDACHAGSGQAADEVNVVRDLAIETLNPVCHAGALRIDVWLEDLDDTTCSYGFLCSSDDGLTPYARGERTLVKLDPQLRRPMKWSTNFVEKQTPLLKALHNYA